MPRIFSVEFPNTIDNLIDYIDINEIRKIRISRKNDGSFASINIHYKGIGDENSFTYIGAEGEELAKNILAEWRLKPPF